MQRTYSAEQKMTSMQWWIALRNDILREFPLALEDAGRLDEKGNSAPLTDAGFLLREAIRGGYTGVPEGKEFSEVEKKCNAVARALKFDTVGLSNEGNVSAEINKQFRAKFGSISLPQLSSEEDKKEDSTKVMKIFLEHLRRYHKVEKGIGFGRGITLKREGAKSSVLKLNLNITTKCAEIWLIGIPLQEISLAVDAIHTAAVNGTALSQDNPVLKTTPTTEFKEALYGLAEYENATASEGKFPDVPIPNINFETATPDGKFVGKALTDIHTKEENKLEPQALDSPAAVKERLSKEFAKFQQLAKYAIEAAQLSLDTETKATDLANAMEASSYIDKIKLFPENEEATYPNIVKATLKFKIIIDAFYTRKMHILRQHTPMPILQQVSEEHKQAETRFQTAEAEDNKFGTILGRLYSYLFTRGLTWEDTAPSKPLREKLKKTKMKLERTKNLESMVNTLLREIKGRGIPITDWQESKETVRIEITETELERLLKQIDTHISYPNYQYLNDAFYFTDKEQLSVSEKIDILRKQAKAILEDKIKKIPNPIAPTSWEKTKASAYHMYEATTTTVYSTYARGVMFAKSYLPSLPSLPWTKKTTQVTDDDKKSESKSTPTSRRE